jgi:hypothetical protein
MLLAERQCLKPSRIFSLFGTHAVGAVIAERRGPMMNASEGTSKRGDNWTDVVDICPISAEKYPLSPASMSEADLFAAFQ